MVEHSPAGRRALIVEDETVFAMGLAVDMQALGFANCDLAANGQDAFLKAMEDQPRAGGDSSCHPMLSITCQCSITNGEVLRPWFFRRLRLLIASRSIDVPHGE
jgi:hypothetical protein